MNSRAPGTSVANRNAVKRFVRLIHGKTANGPALILIATERKTARYHVEPIANDLSDGKAFLIKEATEPLSDVYACIATGDAVTCDCLGHQQHGTCKHVDALAALVAAGKI
jgi:hypothetical protein